MNPYNRTAHLTQVDAPVRMSTESAVGTLPEHDHSPMRFSSMRMDTAWRRTCSRTA